MPGIRAYVLDHLPSQIVLGMSFLRSCNPAINWLTGTVTFGTQVVLALPVSSTATVGLCSVRSLWKTIRKHGTTAWITLLQPSGSLLSMGASGCLEAEQGGVATPPAPGADHPAIAPLLSEFADVFQDPVFPPADRVTHDISLLDPSDQPPKPKQYRLSPAE